MEKVHQDIQENFIHVKGARLHNLKHVEVVIPRDKLVVITGLSGSGKSSLAFDTLYAEGQRRYVESLSSYARQFLGKLDKPQVDYIKGIPPAIAIEQKVGTTNPRSTVGTSTEIYDYIKLLFARIGKTYSPISDQIVQKHTVGDVVAYVQTLPLGTKLFVLAPLSLEVRTLDEALDMLQMQGFSRVKINGEPYNIEEIDRTKWFLTKTVTSLQLVLDRVITKSTNDFYNRITDSIEVAFYEGHGVCQIEAVDLGKITIFSNTFELDGLTFNEPDLHYFSFNNPYGACKQCEGYGSVIGISEDLVVPNKSLSIYESTIACWRGEKAERWKKELIKQSVHFDFPIHKPYYQLSDQHKKELWEGNVHFDGIHAFFHQLEAESHKIQNRVILSRFRGKTICPSCQGKRLRKETEYVKIDGYNIQSMVDLPLICLAPIINDLSLNPYELTLTKRIRLEISQRLDFLLKVGLGYLTLNRASNTLSGGESQRINLATSLGSSLVGSMYVLDEPSIGLHSKDTERLIEVLKYLRDLGNSVIVVEHDEEIMRAADYIFDLGPEAGDFGGEIVAQGTFEEFLSKDSLTAQYLQSKKRIEVPTRRTLSHKVNFQGIRAHNLKDVEVDLPLRGLVVVTGVSGSGKSTLLKSVVYPALAQKIGMNVGRAGEFDRLEGDYEHIKQIEFIDQNPIGKSSRSNPITYIKAYDDIRNLLAQQKLAKVRNYKPSHFSFNVDGGRCEVCKGEGEITVDMQFMSDIHLVCEVCKGNRFKKEVLEVTFEHKNIANILAMTIDEAIAFFKSAGEEKISMSLLPLKEVGLGYVRLGQSSNTLSGGEAQRVKLASFLGKGLRQAHTLFIFDEPSTGLHFHDIKKLLKSFEALIDKGHSIFVIEHNIDIIKCADYLIDLGPEGGEQGGYIVAKGTPEEVAQVESSYTGQFLKEKLI